MFMLQDQPCWNIHKTFVLHHKRDTTFIGKTEIENQHYYSQNIILRLGAKTQNQNTKFNLKLHKEYFLRNFNEIRYRGWSLTVFNMKRMFGITFLSTAGQFHPLDCFNELCTKCCKLVSSCVPQSSNVRTFN